MNLKIDPKNLPQNLIDLAYFAGYFDGEGYITMKLPSKKGTRAFQLVVGVTSGDGRVVERFWKAFGGSFILRKPGLENRRQIYSWTVCGKTAQSVLRCLQPYLDTDKAKAIDLVLTLTFKQGNQHTTPEEVDRRTKARNTLMEINRRVTVP